ncbi:biotin-dependent carboxyltransferase family protein [Hyphomonas sp.]|jgi:biotin-dependent carboxylase-like uncharacterized protein|uniref:5-oxoprolinase subunit C family protein n=1 Tax=Hyphomonas sp. TaxID=87 RepID=UPI0032D97388
MTVRIIEAGPQATLQGAPRGAYRHFGIPAAGPADPLSHAIANRLVGNASDRTCIEITYGPFSVEFMSATAVAFAGAIAPVSLNDQVKPFHHTLFAEAGDVLKLGRADAGLRTYLGIAGGFQGEDFLSSQSTYLPAGFGGLEGRALKSGDMVSAHDDVSCPQHAESTPEHLRFPLTHSFALRASQGPDYESNYRTLWTEHFVVTRRASRIGIELDGDFPDLGVAENLPSAGVFPGALQLPPRGRGFLLLPDCQTTGGYPHILQVNRSDRHLLGQLRPGDSLIFLQRTPEQAAEDLASKQELLGSWLTDFQL